MGYEPTYNPDMGPFSTNPWTLIDPRGPLDFLFHFGSAFKDNNLQDRPGPQIGQNPYLGGWNSLISQLQQQAKGEGPSLAGNAFRQASDAGMKQQQALAAGGSAGQARQASMNMSNINQGQAAGYSNARLQEMMAGRQALAGALGGAGNAWFQPQQANLTAQMNTPSKQDKIMKFLGQIMPMLAGGA